LSDAAATPTAANAATEAPMIHQQVEGRTAF
jgi:hypothetical protein